MRPLRILVIEDEAQWAKDIQDTIRVAAKKIALSVDFMTAETTLDAKRMIREHCFHGISIDQNMPEALGGEVSWERGRTFISELRAWDPPGFMALFTGRPNTHVANFAGAKAQIPYIVKSQQDKPAADDNQYMTVVSYSQYFMRQVRRQYITRVLSLVQDSGFVKLHTLARDTSAAYEQFADTEFQDAEDAKVFFLELSKFRENFNLALASFLMGLSSGIKGKPGAVNAGDGAARVEAWLSKQLNALDEGKHLEAMRDYFGMRPGEQLSSFYVGACASLRERRNPAMHSDWVFAPEDFDTYLGDIFSFFDVVAWLMRRPLITAPYKRENYLVYYDLNHRHVLKAEMFYRSSIPETQPGRVFTQLREGGNLIALDNGLNARRDKATNRMLLEQAYY